MTTMALSYLAQFELGVRPFATTALCIVAGLLVYAVTTVFEFGGHFFRLPPLHQRQALERIADLQAQLAAPSPFRVTLSSVELRFAPSGSLDIHARVEVRNINAEDTTLHDLTLHRLSEPLIAITDCERHYFCKESEQIRKGSLRGPSNIIFHAPSMTPEEAAALLDKGTKWQFSFTDIAGRTYQSNVYEQP